MEWTLYSLTITTCNHRKVMIYVRIQPALVSVVARLTTSRTKIQINKEPS
jgi:hypothetical protein